MTKGAGATRAGKGGEGSGSSSESEVGVRLGVENPDGKLSDACSSSDGGVMQPGCSSSDADGVVSGDFLRFPHGSGKRWQSSDSSRSSTADGVGSSSTRTRSMDSLPPSIAQSDAEELDRRRRLAPRVHFSSYSVRSAASTLSKHSAQHARNGTTITGTSEPDMLRPLRASPRVTASSAVGLVHGSERSRGWR